MNKISLKYIAAILVTASILSPSLFAGKNSGDSSGDGTTASTSAANSDSSDAISGKVISVDVKAKTITVGKKKDQSVISITDKTKFAKNTSLSDIMTGSKVKVTCEKNAGGKLTAKSVKIAKPKEKDSSSKTSSGGQ
jgi:Cu/Ag efflux protein CusF